MPPDSSVVVHVPFGYPTALFFVDESSVKASAGRFFVVGAIKLRRPGHLMRAIADIRDRYEFRGEFKFSNITRGSFAMCCELIDAIHCSDARISACVVDRATGRDPFQGNTPPWLAHAQVTTALLAGNVNRRELAAALVDHVSTPKGSAFDDTVRNMVNRRLRSTSLVSVACADSACTDGLQLADLVAGSVAHHRGDANNTASPTSYKGKVATRLAAAFDVESFTRDTRNDRVHIATFCPILDKVEAKAG
jgi:hypothetical protein